MKRFTKGALGLAGNVQDPFSVLQPRPRFSDFQRSAFGNFASGVGGKLVELVFPTPQPFGNTLDWSLVTVVDKQIGAHMDEAAGLILERLDDVKKWLNSRKPEFGEIWCAFATHSGRELQGRRQRSAPVTTGGSPDQARAIRSRITSRSKGLRFR